ncbi:hydroxymethylglutaryl-coenzyme A synthase C terminal-domain-containing protein [Powellomyces hirtus]|nr:hydroxymethylglutaryl-coenzyme A synthase C terminal-domain-containing protein [Powellomyces hirtus]
MLSATPPNRAENVGIHAIDIYFPKKFVDQSALEQHDGVSAGKYTIGLGQQKMGICDDREDINTICMTVVQSLLEKYSIAPTDIGRLEVGTETIIDKSKSVKSVLMQLFAESGNTDIEGVDTTNACYGGTNALFNAINWVESSSWDGRYALVVAADIAVYKTGAARPTGGAGAVAILVGPDAPLVFDRGLRATHMEHVYDFYKPDLHSEYPEVDGPLSNTCYIKAVDVTYNRYLDKLARVNGVQNPSSEALDYILFHCPYAKLVAKSVARVAFNDFLRNPTAERYGENLAQFAGLKQEDTYTNRDVEKAFMEYTKQSFKEKTLPSLLVPKNLGNSYTASLYTGLVSLLATTPSAQLQQKRVGMFSYGSGLAASFFSLTVCGSTAKIAAALNLTARLAQRTEITPARYDEIMNLREKTHNVRDYTPIAPVDDANLWNGAYYMTNVDSKFRRSYERRPNAPKSVAHNVEEAVAAAV